MDTEQKSAKVISFINMKGGVGKTTLCIGLADYLANTMGKKVLLIDVDPQFNATQSFVSKYHLESTYLSNYNSENQSVKTVKSIFHKTSNVNQQFKMPTSNEVIHQLTNNLHIVFGDINLIYDNVIDSITVKRIKKFINENKLITLYDFIFIDCPPTISMFTEAALIASDYYLTPVKIDQYSILGVTSLLSVIEDRVYNQDLHIKPLGIIYTESSPKVGKKGLNLKQVLEKKLKELDPDMYIFANTMSYTQDLMVGQQGNVPSSYLKSEKDIKEISEEFLSRLKGLCND